MRLIGSGLWSVLAPDLAGTRAALADSRRGLRRQRGFLGDDFKPQLTAFDGELGAQAAPDRMQQLATLALDDLAGALPDLPPGPLALALLLPEPAPEEGLDQATLTELGRDLASLASSRIGRNVARPALHLDGAVGLAATLNAHASALMQAPLLVLAVDTLACRRRLLTRLDASALFSDANPWGMVPGEGAAALLLGPGPAEAPHIAGFALEREPIGEADPGDSDYGAITRACWTALPEDSRPVTRWLTDWNNSRYRAAEMSYLRLRIGEVLADGTEPDHLALRLGETGAAGPAMALAIHGFEAGGRILLTSGAPGSNLRAVVVIDGPAP
ncbi:hypothetical protein [Jannaschia sp. CCS1]|uniref:hypothetical protein n=1 Tax=Jannaschia sp. (strain CCS1) TaxID=290400 RepID=UPI000053D990|nr:hypothetical protein [Jannaschia sp. CCS1]ABD55929.1 hypothetical protein Jann_3012 [Jannaschia sp. CCS1]